MQRLLFLYTVLTVINNNNKTKQANKNHTNNLNRRRIYSLMVSEVGVRIHVSLISWSMVSQASMEIEHLVAATHFVEHRKQRKEPGTR